MTKWLAALIGSVLAGVLVWTFTQIFQPYFTTPGGGKLPPPIFKLTYPTNGDTVDRAEPAIAGATSYMVLNHYIIVTSPTGGDSIEDGPLKVSAQGQWTGQATFGTATAGKGKKYIVRSLATKSRLSPGPINEIPEDAIFSDPITVTRR